MNTFGTEDSGRGGAIIKFVGSPNEPDKPSEPTRWQRFLRFVWPWAQKTGWVAQYGAELGQAFAEAELAKRQGEAQKLAMDVANAAAERDHKEQQTVRVVNEEIARIFSQDEQPDVSRKLQLANLLAANPQIAEQLEVIESLYAKLRYRHGALVELTDASAQVVVESNQNSKTPE